MKIGLDYSILENVVCLGLDIKFLLFLPSTFSTEPEWSTRFVSCVFKVTPLLSQRPGRIVHLVHVHCVPIWSLRSGGQRLLRVQGRDPRDFKIDYLSISLQQYGMISLCPCSKWPKAKCISNIVRFENSCWINVTSAAEMSTVQRFLNPIWFEKYLLLLNVLDYFM